MGEPNTLRPVGSQAPVRPASVPPVPVIKESEWGNWPNLLVSSRHLSVGWQDRPKKNGGPCYLVGRTSSLTGGTKVLERFPLTGDGWAKAWRFLVARDKTLVDQIRQDLDARAAADRARAEMAELDASALVHLRAVVYLGGYTADLALTVSEHYDLRFLADRIMIAKPRSTQALTKVPYGDVEELEVGGPGIVDRMSRAAQAGMTVAFGLTGAAFARVGTKIQTIVRIQAPGNELHFLCGTATPDVLRVELSRPLAAIREARASRAAANARQAEKAAAAVGELSRLASLLEAGLLTRAEFDELKAQLLGGS